VAWIAAESALQVVAGLGEIANAADTHMPMPAKADPEERAQAAKR